MSRARAKWSAKAAARALFREAGTWPMRDEDWTIGYARALSRAYLAALSVAFRNGPTGLADFVRDERVRLAAKPARRRATRG